MSRDDKQQALQSLASEAVVHVQERARALLEVKNPTVFVLIGGNAVPSRAAFQIRGALVPGVYHLIRTFVALYHAKGEQPTLEGLLEQVELLWHLQEAEAERGQGPDVTDRSNPQ